MDFVFANLSARADIIIVLAVTTNSFRCAIGLGFGLILRIFGLFGFNQRSAIRNGGPVLVRVDFTKCEESLAIAAIFYECRLQGRLDPGHPGQIYISL